MKKYIPDIKADAACLCARVRKSNEDDWKILRRIIVWLKSTTNDVRKISATSLANIYTRMDTAYEVCNDTRSQMGGATSIGHGVVYCKSVK